MTPTLSIIIPTFNERDNISKLLHKLESALIGHQYEAIVVDDDSPDQTWKIAQELSVGKPYLKVLHRKTKKGLSSAVIDGFKEASGRYLAVIDADMQHDERILPQMVKQMGENEIVIGSRKAENGGIKDWSYFRRFTSWVAGKLAHWTLKCPVKDPMSGFFMIRREVFERCSKVLNPKGFKILLEILHKSKPENVHEVGYTFKPREYGESKLDGDAILNYLVSLYELKFSRVLPLDFVKYCLVGGTGVFVNLLTLTVLHNVLGVPGSVALITGIGLAMVTNFFLNNFWTFKGRGKEGLASKLMKFSFTCSVGALINYSVAMVFIWLLFPQIQLADLIGIVAATLWNYWINKKWTWGK